MARASAESRNSAALATSSGSRNPPVSGWRRRANRWVASSAAARTDIRLVVSEGATALTRMPWWT